MAVMLDEQRRVRELARAGRLVVRVASDEREIEAAQRLRWDVFSVELGAKLQSGTPGLDADRFDSFCEHLIVEDEQTGTIVGTYRLLLPEQAKRAGGLYTENEFATARLSAMRGQMVELGRSCVHRDYRTGATIMLLWAGIGELLAATPCRFVIGCASVPADDGGGFAASLWRKLWRTHAAPEAWRVFPKNRLDVDTLSHACDVVVPPLVKGYLRAGGLLLGEPHLDRDFGCADFPMLLSLDRLDSRYSRRFVRAS